MNDNILNLVLLGILIFATLLGLALMGYGVRNIIDARKSNSWPTVEGEITRSVMTEKLDDDSRTRYTLHINYDYTIDRSRFTGKRFKGDRIEFVSPDYHDREEAESVLGRYPLGEKVTVYYDPEHPAKSVLVPGNWAGNIPLIAAGLLFFGLGALFIMMMVSEVYAN